MPIPAPLAMSRRTRRDLSWAVRHRGDCVPEATSGRADPDRGGRHQHSLRDLDGCSAGDAAGGVAQAAAPLIDAPMAPGSDDWHPVALDRGHHSSGTPLPASGDGLSAATEGGIEGVVRFDPLTGISVLLSGGATTPTTPPDLVRRIEEAGRIQVLAGGVLPGDCGLATALVRRSGRTVDDAGVASVSAALWEIMADGDLGDAQGRSDAGRRAHGIATARPLGLSPQQLAQRCREMVAEVEARAADAAWLLTAGFAPPLQALDVAVLQQVLRDPATAERGIAAALAATGATQGRVYRALGRLGLTTRAARRAWVAQGPARQRRLIDTTTPEEIAAVAGRLAADGPELMPLYRYHLAAAICRRQAGAAVSVSA